MSFKPANPTMLLPNGAVPTVSTSYTRRYSGWSPSLGISYRQSRADDGRGFYAGIRRDSDTQSWVWQTSTHSAAVRSAMRCGGMRTALLVEPAAGTTTSKACSEMSQ